VSPTGPPARTEAVRGVEERLAATLHAYPGLRLDPIPAQFLRVPETGAPPQYPRSPGAAWSSSSGPGNLGPGGFQPGEGWSGSAGRGGVRAGAFPGTPGSREAESPGLVMPSIARFFGGGGHRVLRGGHLRDLGGDAAAEAYDLIRELWESAGCPVDDVTGLDGRMLVVHDPAGYLITVTRHGGDDPILTVASPPIASQFLERGLLAGLLSGLLFGCGGPCVSSVGPMTMFPAMVGLSATYWGWVPLFALVVGVTLWRPETRRFGAGLLVAGALVGFTVAGIVS
jgi:hypothetical protein